MNKNIIFFIILFWLSATLLFAQEPVLPIVLKIENKSELLQKKIKTGDTIVLNIEMSMNKGDAIVYLQDKYAAELWLSGGLNLLNTDFKFDRQEGTNRIYRLSGIINNNFINAGSKQHYSIKLTVSGFQQENIFFIGLLPEIQSKKYRSGCGTGDELYIVFEENKNGKFIEQLSLD